MGSSTDEPTERLRGSGDPDRPDSTTPVLAAPGRQSGSDQSQPERSEEDATARASVSIVHPWRLFIVLTALFFAIGASWSFSTAPGGSPDEIQHIFRAWTVWDNQIRLAPVEGGGAQGDVATGLITVGATKLSCFVFKSEASADCAEPWPDEMGLPLTTLVLSGRYNPVYYLAVGWPLRLLSDPLAASYLMRLVSSMLSALLLALAAVSASYRTGPLARVGVILGLTPMAMFLAGTVNPSGLEIAGAVCGWTGVLLLTHDPSHSAIRLWATSAGIGLSLMVLSRPASYLWLVPIAVVALVMLDRQKWRLLLRRPAIWCAAGVVTVSLAFVLLWSRIARTSELSGSTNAGTLRQGLIVALGDVSGWWYQQVGVLGFLDTPAPASVVATTAASVLVPVVLTFAWTRGRERLVQTAALVMAVLVPLAAATALYPSAGRVWQGRYNLPISVGFVIVAAILLDDVIGLNRARRLSLARWLGGLWAFAGVVMVYYNLQRYSVGEGKHFLFLFDGAPWSGPLPGLVCLSIAAVGYVGVLFCLFPRETKRTLGATSPLP